MLLVAILQDLHLRIIAIRHGDQSDLLLVFDVGLLEFLDNMWIHARKVVSLGRVSRDVIEFPLAAALWGRVLGELVSTAEDGVTAG